MPHHKTAQKWLHAHQNDWTVRLAILAVEGFAPSLRLSPPLVLTTVEIQHRCLLDWDSKKMVANQGLEPRTKGL